MAGETRLIDGERAHYLRSVLRLRAGARLIVFNGEGGEFDAEAIAVSRREVMVKVGSWCDREAESPLNIALGLGIAKGERMDWAVQKAVELGVHSIHPLETRYSNVRLKGDKRQLKHQHWVRIAVAACEQCGRNRIPRIFPPQPLSDWIPSQKGGVMLDPEGAPWSNLRHPQSELALLIGPEGGLSSEEIHLARDHGFVGSRLGPRILRVETAVVAALSVAQSQWGDC